MVRFILRLPAFRIIWDLYSGVTGNLSISKEGLYVLSVATVGFLWQFVTDVLMYLDFCLSRKNLSNDSHKVVKDKPVQVEVLLDPPIDELGIAWLKDLLVAYGFAGLVDVHLQVERGCLDPVAEQDAAQRLGDRLGAALGLAEVEGIVVVVEAEGGMDVGIS